MCLMKRMMMKPVRRATTTDARTRARTRVINLWCMRLFSSRLALLGCGARGGSPHLIINSRSPRVNLTHHLSRPRLTRRVITLLPRATYAEH